MPETTAVTTSKPGYKTTEFWLALAATVIGTLLASGAIGETSPTGKALAFLAAALAQAGYAVSRGMAKASK